MKLSKETALYEKDAIKNGINNAAGTATKYVSTVDDNGIFVAPEGKHPKDLPATGKTGWSISDAIELFKNGVSYIKAWLDSTNTPPTPKVRIGTATGGNVTINNSSVDICDGGEALATFYSDQSRTYIVGGDDLAIVAHNISLLDDASWNSIYHQPTGSTKNITLTTAGVSNYVSGPSLALRAGMYIIIGRCKFPSLGTSAGRHNSIRLLYALPSDEDLPYPPSPSDRLIVDAFSNEGAGYTATLDIAYIFDVPKPLTGDKITITLQASSSVVPSEITCTAKLMAIRIL